MPAYTTDPDALVREIHALPVTTEPIPDERDAAMSPEDNALVSEIFFELHSGSPELVRELKRLVRKYPEVPTLKNHLMLAYAACGNERASDKVNARLLKENPDYLFGHLNHASKFLRPGHVHKALEILGGTLRLADFKPGVELFHHSEVKGYYLMVGHFHLIEGNLGAARAIYRTLTDIVGEGDKQLAELAREIANESLRALQDKIKEEDQSAVRVTPKPLPSGGAGTGEHPPELHHPEVASLYDGGFAMPRELIGEILALPRETLVADLVTVLRDGSECAAADLETGFEWDDEDGDGYFMLHAMYFLGELGATEALDAFFAVLSENPEVLDLWFGEALESDLWAPLYALVKDELAAARAFALTPGVDARAKTAVSAAVHQVALHDPGRREEVLGWYREVLEFMLATPAEDNVLDFMAITSLVNHLISLRANELLPLIEQHWEKGHILETVVGNIEEIGSELAKPPDEHARKKLSDLKTRYRQFVTPNSLPPGQGGGGLGDDIDWGGQMALPAPAKPQPKPDAGRNDPCPCGSGKKFKRCCM